MTLLLYHGTDDLNPSGYYFGKRHRLHPQFDSTLGNPGNIQKIIHQAAQVCDLAFNRCSRGPHVGVAGKSPRQQLARIADRRQWISKLVRQHREELILMHVRGFQFLLHRLRSTKEPTRASSSLPRMV
jgi:hypothetical protein